MKNRISVRGGVLVAAVVFATAVIAVGAQSLEDPDSLEPVQSAEESLATDLALAAEARGWTIEEAVADYKAAAVVGRIAEQVAAERPEIFVGSALALAPGGAPALHIKGPADQFVRDLVNGAEIEVKIVDGEPFSFSELEERQTRVHRALAAQGFRYIATSFSFGGQIEAEVTMERGSPSNVDEILSRLPSDLQASVKLTVSDVPVAVLEHAFGGMWVRDDGVNECTSGWAVENAFGTTGVTTAGHCTGVNEIVQPGTGGGTWDLTFQGQHRGDYGDIEWHTTTHAEPPKFYASETVIRNVSAIEPVGNITLNETVCVYGRASNSRDCSLQVENVSVECTFDGILTKRLVRMDGDTQIGGDSGGPWYFGQTAYGGHVGNCPGGASARDVFSVVDLIDEALNINVQTE
ncbi:MAG: hypothetical protein IIC94_04360 [Chloroflexi bacterium]|nr:hypothetical protein [Chloroflexota bacterium]